MIDTALGWTLVHFLWQGTAIAALLGLWLAVAQSARVRYASGCFALGLMAVCPVVTYWWLRQPGMVSELSALTLVAGTGNALSRAVVGAEPIRWIAWLPLLWLAGVAMG